MKRVTGAVAALIVKVAAAVSVVGTAPAASAVGIQPGTPLVVIWMENKERSTIEGSADADYLKSFEADGRTFLNYYGVTHPSLPNYLAFASGSTQGKDGTDSITAGEISGSNLWGQLSGAAVTWRVFEEDMPSACYGGTSSGDYQLKHNPAIPFNNVYTNSNRCAKVVPYTNLDPNNLPEFSFITPDMCHDMHDCSIATGDNWLATEVPPLLAAGAEVIISFDEGTTSQGVNGGSGGGKIYTAIVGPNIIAGNTRTGQFNHYNLLAAIEDFFGVARLGGASGATPLPI